MGIKFSKFSCSRQQQTVHSISPVLLWWWNGNRQKLLYQSKLCIKKLMRDKVKKYTVLASILFSVVIFNSNYVMLKTNSTMQSFRLLKRQTGWICLGKLQLWCCTSFCWLSSHQTVVCKYLPPEVQVFSICFRMQFLEKYAVFLKYQKLKLIFTCWKL